jgi:hypothetical protein
MRVLQHAHIVAAGFALAGLLAGTPAVAAKRPPPPEPDLRIIQVTTSPDSYVPGQGTLDLAVDVDLPTYLDGDILLEVSFLISSPSKRSMRFLTSRQPLTVPQANSASRVSVTLTWDGTDQRAHVVGGGRYTYEVRAKLLTVGEKGPRTLMLSWPKRGALEIK